MAYELLEHPDISAAIETGFARRTEQREMCYQCCDAPATFFWFDGAFCSDCALMLANDMRKEQIEKLEDMSDDELLSWATEIRR